MRVRAAADDDRVDAIRVLDGALLEVADVEEAIDRGDVLVACVEGPDGAGPGDERVVGVIVLEPHDDTPDATDTTDTPDAIGAPPGAHVAAIAVNPSRRGRGIGSALVETARDRYGRLTADFRAEVEPFWRELGFAVEARGDRRWGERS